MNHLETESHRDEHNLELLALVHPDDWTNPVPSPLYDIVVIGAGTAGLVTCAIASGLGAKVALVERRLLGGDCLNFGCVPSKTLIRSARACYEAASSGRFGIEIEGNVRPDFELIMKRVRRTRAEIAINDSAQRFSRLGVDIFFGAGHLTGKNEITVGDSSLKFRKAVIATGTRPFIPDIPGLREAGFLTNETVFELESLPERLAIIGAGPIGCELAQAFVRLGSKVTLFHKNAHILDREDPDAADILQKQFLSEGIHLKLNASLSNIISENGSKTISFESGGASDQIEVDQILVASGRSANVQDIGLEIGEVKFDPISGISVNDYLQTTNPNVYSAGDVCMKYKFTHAADASARIVVQNALFFRSKKVSDLVIPWCIYTDPEIAHVGLNEAEARAKGIRTRTITVQLSDIDRARTDDSQQGFARILLANRGDRILGATVVAKGAGDLISELSLAITSKTGLKTLSATLHPYPTQSEIIKKLSDAYVGSRLSPRLRWILGKWFQIKRFF